jgi:hypothetical protein
MQRWRIINAVLVFFVILLLFEIYNTWARTLVPVDLTPRPLPAASTTGSGGARARRAAERNAAHGGVPSEPALVATIAEKDLFDPSRRPPPPEELRPPDPVPRQVDPPAGVTFTGVRIMGPDREAFVTENSQKRRLRKGDVIASYTVKEIQPTRLVLESPSGDPVTMRLGLAKPGAGGGTAAPGRGPARPGQQPPVSPAAGVQGNATAAGVAVRPAVPIPPAPPPVPAAAPGTPPAPGAPQPPQNPQINQLPPDVRQKLEQLKAKDAGRRHGRDR